MLERFKVPEEDQVRVPEDSLRETVAAVFEKMGEVPEDAAIGADVLVRTDLRGVETHGVSNMLRTYVNQYNQGTLNPRPNWKIVREAPGTAVIDADKGLAVILGPKAMNIAIDKARNVGVGFVSMFNAGHSGGIGHHAMLAAEQDMVGMVTTAASLQVVPTFGAEPRYGTNPIAMAAPAKNEPPFLYDAATSAVAGNKLGLARRVGAEMEPGWITKMDGTPIMEEWPVPEQRGTYYHLPLGGTRELGSHKGYGLALMTEVLGTMLSGVLPNMVDLSGGSKHSFTAYNIAAFTDVDEFKEKMDRMLQTLRDTKPAPGHDRVLYPGLSEYEEEQDRRANGIPLHKEVIEWFGDICGELSIPMLRTM
ncbi:MAG: Ldh family oxidoreductase [Chloroflexi bacterium]|nr:Ldh family oxidoreductase [Chloroflexota bacterium]MDA1226795.1 Ldh family oxidoreductase [Chloroflexota bacterium]